MEYKQPPTVSITRPTETAPRSSGGIGLLGAGANIVSGLVNNVFARANAREQRAWQEKMWHEQNAYNDPSAMKERMLAAGLNPYQMTGAEPAGSAGTGATAETFPIADPLAAIRAIAEIKGINAQASKTESETDKIIQETINLQIAERLGLVSAEEADLRMKDLRNLYGTDRSPVELSAQETESRISENLASSAESVARQGLLDAQTLSENTLRDLRSTNLHISNEEIKAKTDLARKQWEETVERIKNLSYDNAVKELKQNVNFFYGIDVSSLPPELQIKAGEYYLDCVNGKYDYDSTCSAFYSQVDRYIEKNGHIVESYSFTHSDSWGTSLYRTATNITESHSK